MSDVFFGGTVQKSERVPPIIGFVIKSHAYEYMRITRMGISDGANKTPATTVVNCVMGHSRVFVKWVDTGGIVKLSEKYS